MKWALTSSEPVTTESERSVQNANGVRGTVRVRWVAGCVRLGTHVYETSRSGRVVRTLDPEAEIVDWKNLNS